MNDDTERQTRPAGRSIRVLAFGDNMAEVELAALDGARAFFGADLRMEIVPDYQVHDVRPNGSLAAKADGKQYQADVTVRVVES